MNDQWELKSNKASRMEKDPGYQALMERPDVREYIARRILEEANPHFVAYTKIIDEVENEFDLPPCRQAINYMLGSKGKIYAFVFESFILNDAAYERFKADSTFRETFFSIVEDHDLSRIGETEDYANRIAATAEEIERTTGVNALYFLKLFLMSRVHQQRFLNEVKVQP